MIAEHEQIQVLVEALVATGRRLWSTSLNNTPAAQRELLDIWAFADDYQKLQRKWNFPKKLR